MQFREIYGDDFAFVPIHPIGQGNVRRMAGRDLHLEPFVMRPYESPEAALEIEKQINEAECVIVGGVPVNVISSRLELGKITFMQSERFFKGPFLKKDLGRFIKYCMYKGGRREAKDKTSKFYLLCSSAFAAWDYNTCGLFKGKTYRWGYFPELKQYDDIDN